MKKRIVITVVVLVIAAIFCSRIALAGRVKISIANKTDAEIRILSVNDKAYELSVPAGGSETIRFKVTADGPVSIKIEADGKEYIADVSEYSTRADQYKKAELSVVKTDSGIEIR